MFVGLPVDLFANHDIWDTNASKDLHQIPSNPQFDNVSFELSSPALAPYICVQLITFLLSWTKNRTQICLLIHEIYRISQHKPFDGNENRTSHRLMVTVWPGFFFRLVKQLKIIWRRLCLTRSVLPPSSSVNCYYAIEPVTLGLIQNKMQYFRWILQECCTTPAIGKVSEFFNSFGE